jgi:hypothetical protein
VRGGQEVASRVGPADRHDHRRCALELVEHLVRRACGASPALTGARQSGAVRDLGHAQRTVHAVERARRIGGEHLGMIAHRLAGADDRVAITRLQVDEEENGDRSRESDAEGGERAVRATRQLAKNAAHLVLVFAGRRCRPDFPPFARADGTRSRNSYAVGTSKMRLRRVIKDC